MQRNKIIDIAKGIGIMLVVYTHTKCYAHDAIYIFIMPLFFALSGYFFNEGRTIKENIKNKFNSLIIPYIFYFLLVQCLFILVHKFFYQDIYFAWGMFFKPYWAVGPMWFFWGLFFTSVFFTLIAKAFKKTYLIILLSLIFSIGGYFLSIYKIQIPLYIDSALSMTVFYAFGYLLKKYNVVEKLNTKTSIIIGVSSLILYSLAIVFQIVNNTKPNEVPQNYPLFLLSAMGAIMIFLIVCRYIIRFKFISNLLSFYGKESLIIFVFHVFTFYLLCLLFNLDIKNLTYLQGFLITIFALILSMIIGLLQMKYLPIPNLKQMYRYLKETLKTSLK
ncbi:MAG: acyltransferase family protein [Bacteroidaceae bacterium]|nr:acyltransferase family protein [Bacteroidaceae bacterium]MEA5100425.1 acyltransferase family protein [Bacteroidales bacterium]